VRKKTQKDVESKSNKGRPFSVVLRKNEKKVVKRGKKQKYKKKRMRPPRTWGGGKITEHASDKQG